MTRSEWRKLPIGTIVVVEENEDNGMKFYDMKIGGATVVCVSCVSCVTDSLFGESLGVTINAERTPYYLEDVSVAPNDVQSLFKHCRGQMKCQ